MGAVGGVFDEMQQLGDPLELRHRAMAALQGSEDTLTLLSDRLPTLQRNASVRRPNPTFHTAGYSACSRCAASPYPNGHRLRALVVEDPPFSPAMRLACAEGGGEGGGGRCSGGFRRCRCCMWWRWW